MPRTEQWSLIGGISPPRVLTMSLLVIFAAAERVFPLASSHIASLAAMAAGQPNV